MTSFLDLFNSFNFLNFSNFLTSIKLIKMIKLIRFANYFLNLNLILYSKFNLKALNAQSIDELNYNYNSLPLMNVPFYYKDPRPVIVRERPIIFTQPKLFVPNSQSSFESSDYLPVNSQTALLTPYRPSLPLDRDLEYGTEKQKKKRKKRKRRKRRRRRRYG